MFLEAGDIIPEALHRKVGWDIRHHFMAEKLIDRFGLKLLRDRELVRQLAVIYVLQGLKRPPEEGGPKTEETGIAQAENTGTAASALDRSRSRSKGVR